ncbi:OMPdecase-domain-containing protein [Tilletiaria anomala UBC 951]|uniref:Endonuclease III homolog n=1 Tax=Tilletiaria anomala (strain ATCC 24038 / CBS 436.72 / UBC 951) TaxID=1037660 RepID=A0A066W594_TILAU|nr:OMPdecase-domain-containing protein [Tilletiaria anomala UBC 951]KDN45935.1 OMPdecase-domain-containing protein [Tilletiaria anomala UBC 951]
MSLATSSNAGKVASVATQTYGSRATNFSNPTAKRILETMERKKTNLCVSVDVTTCKELIAVVKAVGNDVCMVKTHVDILSDFSPAFVSTLQSLAEELDLVIFEDRKFADIGNTVSLQYSSGVHKIASWAHLTNAHLVPGPGIIKGLAKVGKELGRGCLLLAEMSSKGNLCTPEYRDANMRAAVEDEDNFIIGFIAMNRFDESFYADLRITPGKRKDFLILTPGVNLSSSGDAMGQQYRTPAQVIEESGCDMIIVGRGIYGALLEASAEADPASALAKVEAEAKRYREAGWSAYERRIAIKHWDEKNVKNKKRKLFEPSGPAATMNEASRYPSLQVSTRKSLRVMAAASGVASTSAGSDSALPTTPLRRSTRSRTEILASSAVSDHTDSKVENAETVVESNDHTTIDNQQGKGKQAKFFEASPRKKHKTVKVELEPHEIKAAPRRWREAYDVLIKQRKRIIAPVDTMGCEENGKEEFRADAGWRDEDDDAKAKRERFTTLISLMLSSQTKDPVTAEAVKNMQTRLPNGLCLQSMLMATDEEIQSCISKVGFWRRKTGYIKSAARIISEDFGGDVPGDINDLCSIPGVGPKMGFLMLQSMGHNAGIGVDVHVHRMSNRLGWCKTTEPEDTRLRLQSFLPKEMHSTINKVLVGFGQVICVPVGPRCDLCDLAKANLCPSRRKVDPNSVVNRVQVHLLQESDGEEGASTKETAEAEVKVKLEIDGGPDGAGVLLANEEEMRDAVIKSEDPEEKRTDW